MSRESTPPNAVNVIADGIKASPVNTAAGRKATIAAAARLRRQARTSGTTVRVSKTSGLRISTYIPGKIGVAVATLSMLYALPAVSASRMIIHMTGAAML